MHETTTKAIIITRKNYFLAFACLPHAFRTVPLEKVYGCVLLVNDQIYNLDGTAVIAIDNSWISKRDFHDFYAVLDGASLNKKKFVDVAEHRHIRPQKEKS